MAIAAIIGGVIAGAGSLAASENSKDGAEDAAKAAAALQKQAANVLARRSGVQLELPRLDLSGLNLEAEQTAVLGPLAKARTREEFTAALQQFGESFFPTALQASAADVANTQAVLPQATEASRAIGNADAALRSEALEVFAPGSAERRRATLSGLNAFLRFEVPEELRAELNRQAAEQGLRTGQVSGPTAQRASERLTFDTMTRNFFAATQAGQAEQGVNQVNVAGAGLQRNLMPTPSINLELENLRQRTAASLINLENLVNERLSNFQAATNEAASNLARQDQLAVQQTNLLLGQANAQTQTANAYLSAASQERAAGFQAIGSALGELGDFFNAGVKPPAPNPSGLGATQ